MKQLNETMGGESPLKQGRQMKKAELAHEKIARMNACVCENPQLHAPGDLERIFSVLMSEYLTGIGHGDISQLVDEALAINRELYYGQDQ